MHIFVLHHWHNWPQKRVPDFLDCWFVAFSTKPHIFFCRWLIWFLSALEIVELLSHKMSSCRTMKNVYCITLSSKGKKSPTHLTRISAQTCQQGIWNESENIVEASILTSNLRVSLTGDEEVLLRLHFWDKIKQFLNPHNSRPIS